MLVIDDQVARGGVECRHDLLGRCGIHDPCVDPAPLQSSGAAIDGLEAPRRNQQEFMTPVRVETGCACGNEMRLSEVHVRHLGGHGRLAAVEGVQEGEGKTKTSRPWVGRAEGLKNGLSYCVKMFFAGRCGEIIDTPNAGCRPLRRGCAKRHPRCCK